MPFRARMKRALGKSIGEDGTDLTQTTSKVSKKSKKEKARDNIYESGEVMPKAKYRGPVNKEHKDKLESFSFANAFRRRSSDQSLYSPMGSRLPSRRGSFFGRMSMAKSRQQSYVEAPVQEAPDDDVTNVGLSRSHTHEENQRPRTRDNTTIDPMTPKGIITNGNKNGHVNGSTYSKPFTEDELTQAMTRTTLKPASAGKV